MVTRATTAPTPCEGGSKRTRSLPNRLGKSSDLFRGSQFQDVIRADDGVCVVCSLLQAVIGVGGLSDEPASAFFDVFDAHACCNSGFGLIGVANVGGWKVISVGGLGCYHNAVTGDVFFPEHHVMICWIIADMGDNPCVFLIELLYIADVDDVSAIMVCSNQILQGVCVIRVSEKRHEASFQQTLIIQVVGNWPGSGEATHYATNTTPVGGTKTHTTQNETAPKRLRGGFENNKKDSFDLDSFIVANNKIRQKNLLKDLFIVARVSQGVKSYSLFRFGYGMRKPS